jgi:hypothetical protein
MGTFAIVLLEGDDIGAAMGAMITGEDPFNTRFREFIKEAHGVDLAADAPPDVTPVVDNRFQAAVRGRPRRGSAPSVGSRLPGAAPLRAGGAGSAGRA